MNNRDDLDRLFKEIDATLFKYNDLEFVKYFDAVYNKGKNKVYQKNMSETKIFDMDWIKTIESYFPSLDRITKNPRSNLKYEEDVVAIEKAKKINATSVRHLAAHTHYIKEIDEKNDMVIPKKILTINPEQDFQIYENRFISTLINRLFLFVRNRYLIIKENVESFQKDHVYSESTFDISDVNIEMKIDFTMKRDLDDKKVNITNYDFLERVEKLSSLIDALRNSLFMKMMKGTAPVRPPILKTNIILKNPDFKNAYNLWLFLDKYSTLAYDVKVNEKDIPFDDAFSEHVRDLFLINFATIAGNQKVRKNLFNIEGGLEYTKRSNKQLRNNFDDFVDNPSQIQVEDSTLNEYFLNKYKELLRESQEEIKESGKVSDDEALRRALRKTTDIVNSLYNSIFEFEADQNIFNYLITEEDAEKSYDRKKYQLKFAKVIREIKEVDYNNSMRRERKLLKDLESLNKKIIKKKKEEIEASKNRNTIERLKKQVDDRMQIIGEYDKDLDDIDQNKEVLDYEKNSLEAFRNQALNEIKVEVNNYKKQAKMELASEKLILEKQIKDLEIEAKRKMEKLNKEIKSRKEKIRLEIKEKEKETQKLIQEEKAKMKIETEEYRLRRLKEHNEKMRQLKEKALLERKRALQKEKENNAILKVKAYEERMASLNKVRMERETKRKERLEN